MIYFDYNATAPTRPSVIKSVCEAMERYSGNPSSPHRAGQEARKALQQARRKIAELLNVAPDELIFTSGGTESNNLIVRQLLQSHKKVHVITSQTEHPSLLETCQQLEQFHAAFEVTQLPVNEQGLVDPQNLIEAIRPDTMLISLMHVNNETGVILDIERFASIAKEHGIAFHSDCVQALGKLKMPWNHTCIDYASASAHKIGGPHGIGLLYLKSGSPWNSLMTGGKQESSRRAGTENVALALGFAEALICAEEERKNGILQQQAQFKEKILHALAKIEGFFVNGAPEQNLASTLNFGFRSLKAEILLILMDQAGIALSSGSACSSGALEASPVLLAMGRSHAESKSSLRLSMGWNTTETEVTHFLNELIPQIHRLYQK